MIVLPQLAVTDVDTAGGLPHGKAATSAQDFLALLAGALGAGEAQDAAAPTLADLQAAAGRPLPEAAADLRGDTASAATLAELLATRDAAPEGTEPELNSASGLISTLTAPQKEALSAAARSGLREESDPLTEEDLLSDLSALFAMLPGQPPLAPPPGEAPAAQGGRPAGEVRPMAQSVADAFADGEMKHSQPGLAQRADAAAPFTPLPVAAPVRSEAENLPSPLTSGPAPAAVPPATPQPQTVAAAPLLSAPLGSHEWQQSLSQHVTLFTRQGQQSAELRLHPEDLGLVQISLKLDDNQAQLQMVSAHSHVRAALEAALPVLRAQLAESGIQLGQSSISSESFAGQQHASSQQQQTPRAPGQPLPTADDDAGLAAPASLQAAARGRGAVDIFA
ncbi:flagellar hook length control protein FliK [Intestinirhabdus alba]|jgi:flagellar hook-length control protein FliK|uniref:Flagellar hook length control protein FliK n=1 Tax=Intestinirhabdus alba TaxID=2899544 RepID=A0A6L6IMF8_9ENTR|nr:flagellar hook length control protein FliK [Intestinirhabdus alba]MTH48031.1 flagellar hook length control protein FliK [Intestinirhabdus alba]